jgi:hypothetical protein
VALDPNWRTAGRVSRLADDAAWPRHSLKCGFFVLVPTQISNCVDSMANSCILKVV